jgi:hypothetical protein
MAEVEKMQRIKRGAMPTVRSALTELHPNTTIPRAYRRLLFLGTDSADRE